MDSPPFAELRPIDVDDDDAVTRWLTLFNRLKPARAASARELRGRLSTETRYQLFEACDSHGDVVGVLDVATSDLDHEPTLWLSALTDPAAGEPDALLVEMARTAHDWSPREATTVTKAIMLESDRTQLAWWTSHGFSESERQLFVELAIDPRSLPPDVQRDDLTLVTTATRPDLLQQAYVVTWDGHDDIPGDGTYDRPDFDRWRSEMDSIGLHTDDEFLLVKTTTGEPEIVVGYASMLRKDAQPGVVRHSLTTIARDHRGQGLSRVLKHALIREYHARGFTTIGTTNEERNAPIRHLNNSLGYRPVDAFLILKGTLPITS